MNPRAIAVETIGKRVHRFDKDKQIVHASEYFGMYVFTNRIMQKMLSKKIYENVKEASKGKAKINPEYADVIAEAMKDWAMSLGATHFTHLFQPLTGSTAEKHDAFLDWASEDQVLEKFSGKQLIQGEPDASSFPSGGLRSTYEARGYTGWDPSSPVFIWKAGDGATLCIPSVFFSWTGHVLDNKIPLIRSERTIERAVKRLLSYTGIETSGVFSAVGLEQEYFVIDRAFRDLRPDLIILGKTVFGASPSKGQELQDHYFGSIKDRILNFMREFEVEALKLGIPVKTRHNEVAPGQHEVTPVFERSILATDHNIILMELMRHVALKHNLACLLHEKPFGGLNGSGKHCNWSLSTDKGVNLLDPTDTPENNLHFLILLTAILFSIAKHADLLRASIGSESNDNRLGGHEAPPAIMSVYLGEELETFLDNIEKMGSHISPRKKESFDLGVWGLPELKRDNTDRNRTSPFAFTGNKFEMRALGSSASPAFLITVLNVMVADCLNHMLDEIEVSGDPLPVIQKYIKLSKSVRFSGDNYGRDWIEEAKRRKLSNVKRSVHAFNALLTQDTVKAFKNILTQSELQSRYEIAMETYATTANIEANLLIDLFYTQILPAAVRQQKEFANNLSSVKSKVLSAHLKRLVVLTDKALKTANELENLRDQAAKESLPKKAYTFCDAVIPKGEELREWVDQLENIVEDQLWPLPKYREILFII